VDEAGLILRELMDRGEVDAFSVLCPPHLVEQWVGELKVRFGIEAVAVTSGTAARLERSLPLAQTVFDAYPFTVVSFDYIKAEKRRENFARAWQRHHRPPLSPWPNAKPPSVARVLLERWRDLGTIQRRYAQWCNYRL
jgi:hypothetical protein